MTFVGLSMLRWALVREAALSSCEEADENGSDLIK